MVSRIRLVGILVLCTALVACGATRYLRGGIHRHLDEDLTVAELQRDPSKRLHKEFVFSVRYNKKGHLPCPLGEDYVNFSIADRISYILHDKVWIKKEKAKILDSLKEMETIVMKARVFKIDAQKDPNLEAMEIVPE
ncbi:MAG: hypothetical protein FJY85_01355 [Deltaproteobacteria bacterium]|nr:hypothetical protein [Deltaproteobacteria bacterium]